MILAFARSKRGAVALIFALTMPMVIAGAGFGAEVGYWHYEKLKLQQAMDAAAYAAAIEKRAGSSSSTITSAATAAATTDGYNASTDTITVNVPPTSGAFTAGQAVEALGTRHLQRFFSQIFADGTVNITARAVATYADAGSACILALDPAASKSIEFIGNTTVTLVACDVMANSVATDSVYSQGSAKVSAPCVLTVGGVQFNAAVTLTSCAGAMTNLPAVGDPYASLATPVANGPCLSDNNATLNPGNYCSGMSLKNNVTLMPGTYFISSSFKVNANADVQGSGVTLYFADTTSVSLNGNSTMQLTAPTSGTYKGVVMFGSRASTAGSVTINGNNSSGLTGAIYFPNQEVDYIGNFSGNNGCTQVVAKTIGWSGNSKLSVDCSNAGMDPIPVGGVVKLSE